MKVYDYMKNKVEWDSELEISELFCKSPWIFLQ